jgi:copper transport protein
VAAEKLMHAVVAIGVVAALAWSAPSPPVHAILEHSTPAAGDTVAAVPPELLLSFSGPIEEAGAALRILGPGGRTWELEARRRAGDARTLTADLPALEPGGYRVEWRVVSADGHPIAADFVFYVRGGGESADVELAEPPPHRMDAGGAHTGEAGAPHVAIHLIVIRAAADLALLPLAGLLLLTAWGRGSVTPLTDRWIRTLSVAAPAVAWTYAWTWAGETLGDGERLTGLLSLKTGRALAAESTLAVLVPWALLLARRAGLAAVIALLAVAAGGLAGHPASYMPLISLPASVAHVVAASVWVGGLALLVTERSSDRYSVAAGRVSTAALVSVGVIAVTGIVQSWTILGSLEGLTSTFGLIVLGKIAGFAALIVLGAHHRFELLPAAASPQGAARLSRSVTKELSLALCVVALAALLSHIPPTS